MSPVATIMIGRLDDWMKVLVERDGLAVHPDAPNWAGIAAFKRAYGIFRERGYRARLLAAAYRHRPSRDNIERYMRGGWRNSHPPRRVARREPDVECRVSVSAEHGR